MYESREIISGLFNLTYLTNTGAAFGFLSGAPTIWRQVFFVTVALVALGVMAKVYKEMKEQSPFFGPALCLIAGGAIGNLIDRLRQGAVIDFLDFYLGSYHWPAFNVADSAITVGVGVFLVGQFFPGPTVKENN